jgi:hypothetical protein
MFRVSDGTGMPIQCQEKCVFPGSICLVSNTESVYLEPLSHGHTGWPVMTIVDGLPDIENVTDALKNGPYGKCVYESDNDVCDHQVIQILWAPLVSLT